MANRKPPNAGKGRPKGALNKVTRAFKEAVLAVYNARGGNGALLKWSNKEPTEFYRICARLIPTEISGPDGGPLPVHVTQTIDEVKP